MRATWYTMYLTKELLMCHGDVSVPFALHVCSWELSKARLTPAKVYLQLINTGSFPDLGHQNKLHK